MRNRLLPLLIVFIVALACQRSNIARQTFGDAGPSPADAASASGQDSGLDEIRNYHLCPADAGPPTVEAGGLIWRSEVLPNVDPPQDAGWIALSTDPECVPLAPGPLPAQLLWDVTVDGGAACDPARVDGQGDLGVDWLNASGMTTSFLRADGSGASAVHDGNLQASTPEFQTFSISPTGFVQISRTIDPWCYFVRPLDGHGSPIGPAIQSGMRYDESLEMLFPNPLGGFVEVRTTSDGQFGQNVKGTLDVRFVDDRLQPLSGWYNVTTTHQGNLSWALGVDQQGRALVLAFMYPPSFGPPPPPSDWTFTARWIGPGGPLTDEFKPAAPTFTPKLANGSDGSPLFAGWGTFLSLPEGGFAMYHGRVNPIQGVLSPSGWYAFYPSGQSGSEPAPGWLTPYNASLRMLPGGVGYAALQYNVPNSCARTVLLTAPSGRACFKLDLSDTGSCAAFPDALWPDGTLVVQGDDQSTCKIRWWPGVARPAR